MRESIFKLRSEQIDLLNSQNLSYTVAINNFTDWTDSEFKRFNNVSYDENATFSQIEHNLQKVGYPGSKNWDSEGKVTPVRYQGTCGACWAFASTAVFESMLLIGSNRTEDLSEEYILECSNKNRSDCGGGYVNDAYELMLKTGIPTESQYPYKGASTGSLTPVTLGICSASNPIQLTGSSSYKIYANITNDELR